MKTNEEQILGMLHEFRNWNREWDLYMVTHRSGPKGVDAFVEHLNKRWSVKKK